MPTKQKSKPRPPPEQVQQAILQATRQLYLANGYAGTSTDEIAALSAVSKQTIYRHFADKNDLVGAMLRDTIATAEAQGSDAFEALAETDNLDRDLGIFARRHIKEVIQPHVMQLRRRIISEAERYPALARAWYNAAPKRGQEKLQRCFEDLRNRGLLMVDDAELAAAQFNWLVLSIPLNQAMFDPDILFDAAKLEYYADEAVRVFVAAYRGS